MVIMVLELIVALCSAADVVARDSLVRRSAIYCKGRKHLSENDRS